jgi:predicted Zn-dependent protease
MKRALLTASAVALALVPTFALAPRAAAQSRTTGGVRGKCVDEAGKPIEGVKLDLEFKGESRKKIAYSQLSDKKGGFVRTGLPGGPWRILFTKDGYQAYEMQVDLNSGAFSEVPDILMKAAAAAVAPPAGAPAEVVPVMPKDAGSMKDVYNKAVEASRAGTLDEAEALYKQILEKLPDMAEIHYNLGHIYVRKNDLPSAEVEFRRALELKPQRADAAVALAALLTTGGKTQEAADLLLLAAPNFDQDAKFQFILGTTCLNAGKNKEAEAALRKVLVLDPTNATVHFHLGTIAVGENKVPEAVAELEKFVAGTGQSPQELATAKKLIAALKPKR